MAKRKKKETAKKEKVEEGAPTKAVEKREDRQLMWMIFIIVLVIGGMLVGYFYVEGSKSFKYVGANWTVEEYGDLLVYHARFPSLSGADLNYNLYLRNDPRKNDVTAVGNFSSFKKGGYISLSPEVNSCRGSISRVMVDLGSFLKSGLGMSAIKAATSDYNYSLESDIPYVVCNSTGLSVFNVEIGEPGVYQREDDKFCYDIYIENCDDILPVEKFMTEVIEDYSSGQ